MGCCKTKREINLNQEVSLEDQTDKDNTNIPQNTENGERANKLKRKARQCIFILIKLK